MLTAMGLHILLWGEDVSLYNFPAEMDGLLTGCCTWQEPHRSNSPLYICATSSLSIRLLMDT